MSTFDFKNIIHPQYSGTTQSDVTPRVKMAFEPFGASQPKELAMRNNHPYNSETVPDAYSETVQRVLARVVRDIDNINSWELALANMIMVNSLELEIVIRRFPNYVLERQAPNAAFSIVDMQKERHQFSLERYALGLEVDTELMGTEYGPQQFREHMETVIEATIRSFRVDIQEALISAPRYWSQDFGVRRHRSLTSLREFTEQERAMFGAITHDPKGLYKMHALIKEWTQGQQGSPNFNFCVVPHKIALQHAWKHDYPTEAWRTGEASAVANRSASSSGIMLLQTDLPMPVYISSPIHAKNLGDGMDLDIFERIATLGSFTVIEHSDSGPVDNVHGVRIPAIRTPTADMNGYATYTILDCIKNCIRFSNEDDEGSIDDFTQTVIENADVARANWDSGKFEVSDIDPFITVYRGDGPTGPYKLLVCNNFAEQDLKHRSHEFDAKQGRKFKEYLKMTEDEHVQIRLLLQASQDLYEVPPTKAHSIMKDIWLNTDDELDDEWGAPKPNGPINQKPHGYGTWNSVMSLLKNKDPDEDWGDEWELGNKLSYSTLRNLIYRIFRASIEAFPHIGREDNLPFFTKPTSKDNQLMVLLFRGWFERAKYPFWADSATTGRSLTVPSARTGFTDDSAEIDILNGLIATGAANLAGGGLFEFLTDENNARRGAETAYRQLIGLPDGETIYTLIRDVLRAAGAYVIDDVKANSPEAKIRSIQIAYTLAYLLKLLREAPARTLYAQYVQADVSKFLRASGKLAATRGLKLLAGDSPWRLVARGQEYKTKGLCVWKEAFDPESAYFIMRGRSIADDPIFVPTNVLIGDVPIGPSGGGDVTNTQVYAQAKFGAFDELQANVEHFGYDPRQFIVPQSANVVGGPFIEKFNVSIPGRDDTYYFVPRPNVSERCDYVARKLADDPLSRLGAFMFLFSKINRESVLAMVENGLCCPMNFMLAWPFIRVRTMAMLFAEKSPDTCNLYFLLNDITSPADGVRKMEYRHFSTYFAAKVNDPSKIMLIHDAALSGYESGLSSRFLGPDARLQGMNTDVSEFDGVFVMDVPVNFTRESVLRNDSWPIPITGFVDKKKYGAGNFADRKKIFSPDLPHFPTFSAYNIHYGFSTLNDGKEYTVKTYTDLKQSDYIPGEMFPKRVQVWNAISETGGTWTIADGGMVGMGHLDKIDPAKEDFLGALSGTLTFVDRGGC